MYYSNAALKMSASGNIPRSNIAGTISLPPLLEGRIQKPSDHRKDECPCHMPEKIQFKASPMGEFLLKRI